MSKTASSACFELTVSVESHLSKAPSIGTEAFTPNLIVHLTGVILKMATSVDDCAHVIDTNKAEETIQKAARIIAENAKSSPSRTATVKSDREVGCPVTRPSRSPPEGKL